MYLLIPGRHQLITRFQFAYLQQLISRAEPVADIYGKPVTISPIEAVIFPVTSANHSNTRRNPLPFYLRAITIEAMAAGLSIPVFIYGIDDVGSIEDFADYTVKKIAHESDRNIQCTPANTVVICSTPVLRNYEKMGFTILPGELKDVNTWEHHTAMPWDVVQRIAESENWQEDEWIGGHIHPASQQVWNKYKLGEKVKRLFNDDMISSDGDLTETRDYNVYVRQMDEIAGLKYNETAPYIQPGRIGDIGCAVGSWIKLAATDERFRESDFYGIEVSRHLFEVCRQRKENGEFVNPFVFFSQKNAVTGVVFETVSMNTVHTSSLTHEIESYGDRNDLLKFIANRYQELVPGGVWVNRDVVAPHNKEQEVYMWLNEGDGMSENIDAVFGSREGLSRHLQSLSTYARFLRFAKDFRKQEGYQLSYKETLIGNKRFIQLTLADAAEFMSRKDYTDNWQSEMHETFCFWDFEEWKQHLELAGFRIHPSSAAYRNEWIVNNRWKGKAALYHLQNEELLPVDYPVTHMLLVGMK